MVVGCEEKTEMSRYLSENTKTGDFNPQRTLSGSFFVIPQRLASIRSVVLAFTANKQTNILNYIYKDIDIQNFTPFAQLGRLAITRQLIRLLISNYSKECMFHQISLVNSTIIVSHVSRIGDCLHH